MKIPTHFRGNRANSPLWEARSKQAGRMDGLHMKYNYINGV